MVLSSAVLEQAHLMAEETRLYCIKQRVMETVEGKITHRDIFNAATAAYTAQMSLEGQKQIAQMTLDGQKQIAQMTLDGQKQLVKELSVRMARAAVVMGSK